MPLQAPEVFVAAAYLEGDEIVYDFDVDEDDDDGDWKYRSLPDEVVLRELLDLDLDDDDAIVAFVEEFGVINRPYDLGTINIPWNFQNERIAVRDVRAWLSNATLLAKHVVAAARGDVVELWDALDEVHAWEMFAATLSHALSNAYHARVEVWRTTEDDDDFAVGAPQRDLYDALCLQVHQLLVDDLEVRECANPTCRRAFSRQRGRADYGQYRTVGVKFCSSECNNIVKQRRYREKRKRQQKEGEQ
jgi:hypothetical protein